MKNVTNISVVKNFIRDYIISPGLSLNRTNKDGNHDGFIALAAKQAGLQSMRIKNGRYFFDADRCIGAVNDMRTSLVSSIAVSVCSRKEVSKALFTEAGIPTPTGADFGLSDYEQAHAFFTACPGPMVVKPTSAAAGRGVSVGITRDSDFEIAWGKAKKASPAFGRILVEHFIQGIDVRASVIAGEAVAASTRVPPFVVGNGEDTLESLVSQAQYARNNHKYLSRMPIVVDPNSLRLQGYELESIPDEGEIVVVNMTVNMHQGGTNMDITDILSNELKELAVRTAAAVPGLLVSGIDLIVENLSETDKAFVLEANVAANISVHHIPGYGEPVNVADHIITAMKRINRLNTSSGTLGIMH